MSNLYPAQDKEKTMGRLIDAMQWQRSGLYKRRIEMFLTPKTHIGWYARAIESTPRGDSILTTSQRHDSVEDAINEAAALAQVEGENDD